MSVNAGGGHVRYLMSRCELGRGETSGGLSVMKLNTSMSLPQHRASGDDMTSLNGLPH